MKRKGSGRPASWFGRPRAMHAHRAHKTLPVSSPDSAVAIVGVDQQSLVGSGGRHLHSSAVLHFISG